MKPSKWILALAIAAGGAVLGTLWPLPEGPPVPQSAPVPSGPLSRRQVQNEQVIEQLQYDTPRPALDTSPAKSAVATFRQRHLDVLPRRGAAQHIAVSGNRIGRLTRTGLVVQSAEAADAPLRFPLPGARLVAAVPGALLAVGRDRLLLLENGQRKPQDWPRITLLPRSSVLPDLIQRERLWVRHAGDSHLYAYEMVSASRTLLPIVQTLELGPSREGTFLALKDGSFIHHTGKLWERFFTQGKRFEVAGPKRRAPPFRVLRAARIDQFFVVYEDGRVDRLQIQDRLRAVWSLVLPELPIDITSAGDTLITLSAQRDDGSNLNWSLDVYVPESSAAPASIDLGPSPVDSFYGDWVARQLELHGLAASERWLAVGGEDRLRVWNLKELELVVDTSTKLAPMIRTAP